MLACEPTPRRNAAICVGRYCDRDVCVDEDLAAGRHSCGLRSVEVVAGGVSRSTGGRFGGGREELDLQSRRSGFAGERHGGESGSGLRDGGGHWVGQGSSRGGRGRLGGVEDCCVVVLVEMVGKIVGGLD